MADSHVHTAGNYSFYWKIWGALLMLTLGMIFVDQMDMPRTLLILVLLGAMLTKAGLIASFFMHLRYERLFLSLSVFFGLLVNSLVLFVLLVPDGLAILRMVSE
jgi:caa(3)-type oxidase subunit IV